MRNILKQFLGGRAYEDAENLIRIAFMEGKLRRGDIDLINDEIEGIDIPNSDLRIDDSHLNRMKLALPTKDSQKFKLIYLLVKKFNQGKGLNDAKRHVLTEVFSVIHHEGSRIDEMINSVISNITSGNSESETYQRLGYLLKPRQINFN